MTALQLSDLLDMENPHRVLEEVKTIILMIFPGFSFNYLERAFKDILLLFHGEYSGYRGYRAEYHDLRHTLDVFLAMTRLIHGLHIRGKGPNETHVNLGLICALMHDICSIRPLTDVNDETPKPHPYLDRSRSVEFMDTYIAESGLPKEEFRHYDKIIMGANIAVRLNDILFDSQDTKRLGKLLAAATLLSFMADRVYLEKSLFPYYEFGRTEIMEPKTSLEFLKELLGFYRLSRYRLYADLDGINRYVRFHFKVCWNIDRDLYMEAAKKNITYLASLHEGHKKQYRIGRAFDEMAAHQPEERKDTLMDLGKEGTGFGGKTRGPRSMKEVRTYYRNLLTLANDVQSSVERNEPIDISSVWNQVRPLIANNLIESLYHWLVFEGKRATSIAEHSIEVTVLSLMVGRGMGYTKKMLSLLGLLAFLHDVGMYRIPQEILQKKGTLSQRELQHIQKHPEISAGLLSQLGTRFSWLATLSLQVHERVDGTGYPKGIKEENIHEFACIVGLADIYSAMIQDKPYRDSIGKNKAIKTMLTSIKEKFPARIVKVFLQQISFFPAGSWVKLNDMSVGRVITANPEFPLKPFVEILYDHDGTRLKKPKMVNLSRQPHLYIIESVDEREYM